MTISYCPYSLEFKHPFGLAYGSRTKTDVVFFKLEQDGFTGYGEASLPPYLGESHESVIKFLDAARSILQNADFNSDISAIISEIDEIAQNNNAAKAGIDIALHDLFARANSRQVWEFLGLAKPVPKNTSVTISIGDIQLIPQKLQEADSFHILKIKLGNENDKELITEIRKHTDKPMVVDVNQGWKTDVSALEMINWLSDKNVIFVEQPMPKENLNDMVWVTRKSPLPTIADESVKRLEDIRNIVGAFTGINLKLMKSTGLNEAVRMIKEARQKNLKINIGCMTESSCAISAAAQLTAYADWVDLDGPTLIKNNPFGGMNYRDGKVELNDKPGLGVELTADLNFT
jgi:L-Ala-D/L-Glu epimerase